MKMIKISSILLLTVFMMCAFIPDASARHHNRCRGGSFFGLSFNVAPSPSYVVAPAPVAVMPYRQVAPPPVYAYPAYPAYPTYYSSDYYYAPAPVYVERPAPRVHVQPSVSFSFWR